MPTVLYCDKIWNTVVVKKWFNVMEIKSSRSVCGELAGQFDQCVLKWFEHMERMEERKLAYRIMRSDENNER